MTAVVRFVRRCRADVDGSTATEYAIIAFVLAFVLLAVLPGFSASVGALFSTVVAAF